MTNVHQILHDLDKNMILFGWKYGLCFLIKKKRCSLKRREWVVVGERGGGDWWFVAVIKSSVHPSSTGWSNRSYVVLYLLQEWLDRCCLVMGMMMIIVMMMMMMIRRWWDHGSRSIMASWRYAAQGKWGVTDSRRICRLWRWWWWLSGLWWW